MKSLRNALRTTARWCLFASPAIIIGLWISSAFTAASLVVGPCDIGYLHGRASFTAYVGNANDVKALDDVRYSWFNRFEIGCSSPRPSLRCLFDADLLKPLWRSVQIDRQGFFADSDTANMEDELEADAFPVMKGVITSITVLVPFWIPLLLTAVPAAVIYRRHRRFRATGLCHSCGYDLRSTFQPRCPECGRAIKHAAAQTR